jgi:hypothetical protein
VTIGREELKIGSNGAHFTKLLGNGIGRVLFHAQFSIYWKYESCWAFDAEVSFLMHVLSL